MKQRLSAFVILILALAMGTVSPRTQSRVEVPQELGARTAAGESVSVIVGVDTAFVPEGDLPAGAVALQRTSIAQAVELVMARVAAVGVPVGGRFDFIPFFTATVDRLQLEALTTTQGVTSIQVNGIRRASLLQSVPLITAPAAWSAGHTGAGRTVAVLDSGVQKTHPFIGAARVVAEACYSRSAFGTSLCPGGATASTAPGSGVNCSASIEGCEHGTHVAGIVAGSQSGASGVAPGATLIAMQVFTRFDGLGPTGCGPTVGPCIGAFDADIISGLGRVQALSGTHQIAAVNMSVGGGQFSNQAFCDSQNAAMKAAIDNLRSLGIASVVASGNEGFANSLATPACISSAVSVGATTDNTTPLQVPGFSNDAAFLDLLAPGVDIVSSVLGGGFASFDGTSMAAPHVAGAWAILKQAVPAAAVSTVQTALVASGTPVTDIGTGRIHPFINVNAARLLLLGSGGGVPGAPTSFVVTVTGNALNMTWGLPASGGAPTGYTLLARLVPGGPIVHNLPLGNVTSFGINAPNGVFYLSVVATNASGPGPESGVVPVTVPSLPPPPGSPTGLVVNVAGNSATFTWVAPTSGGPVANYVLIAGQTPGFVTPLATLPRPATPTGVVVPGVPPGTWYVRIFASNAGGISASTNEVQVVVAGPQPPGTPTLNTPTVVGHTVGLSWSAGPGGAPTSYTLFASATPGGAPFLSVPGLTGTSAGFNNVPSGTYFLRLVANNALGSSPPSNQVALVVP